MISSYGRQSAATSLYYYACLSDGLILSLIALEKKPRKKWPLGGLKPLLKALKEILLTLMSGGGASPLLHEGRASGQ